LTELYGDPQDWTDEQVVSFIEARQPGFYTVALLRLTNAQTEFAKARGYRHLARAQELSGDWPNAMVNWRKAFRIAWRNNFHTLTMSYLSQLAYTAHKAGELNLAFSYTTLLYNHATNPEHKAYAAFHMSRCLFDAGRFEAMLQYATESIDGLNDQFCRTLARNRIACALNRLGRHPEALVMAQGASAEYGFLTRLDGQVWADNEVAYALCGMGRPEAALAVAKKTLALARTLHDEPTLGRTLLIVGIALSRLGKLPQAERTLTTAKHMLVNRHAPVEEIEVLQELAAVAARRKTA
jgi:tetratricopeptide (TPR) repeat protein